MKVLKWTIVIVGLIGVVLFSLHLRRDWVATRAANTLLADYGLGVSELRVSSLGATRARFASLVIDSEDGARYRLSNVLVVLGPAGERVRAVVADSVRIEAGDAPDGGPELAATLQTALDLPRVLRNAAVSVGQLEVRGYPTVLNLEWATPDGSQSLSFDIGAARLDAEVEPASSNGYRGRLRITNGVETPFASEISILTVDDTVGIDAEFELASIGLWPVAAEFVAVPDQLAGTAARISGHADIQIDGSDLDWRLLAEPFRAGIPVEPLVGRPVAIESLECESGIRCSLRATLSDSALDWSGYRVRSATLSLPLDIRYDTDTLAVSIGAGASGALRDVRTLDLSFESIELRSFSGAEITIDDDWRTDIAELGVDVAGFRGAGDLVATLPVTIRDLAVGESGRQIRGDISLQADALLSWGTSRFSTPLVSGRFSVDADRLGASVVVSDVLGGLRIPVEFDRNLVTGEGTLTLSDAELDFAYSPLSSLFADWNRPFDVVAGTWQGNLDLEWVSDGESAKYVGALASRFEDLAGAYEDIAFKGANGELELGLESGREIRAAPASLTVDLVDIGLPITAVSADYRLDLEQTGVDIDRLTSNVLGGRVSAEPFRYSLDEGPGDVHFLVDAVQLQLMVDLADFENVAVTGTVSGALPVSVADDAVSIDGGSLASDEPGGVIRYSGGEGLEGVVADESFGIVTRSLGNFEFDALSSAVDYDEDGNLTLAMRLSGINPDVDATQPIVLNLTVENNIPQLLRSLQAVRSIEDILERQTTN